MLLTTYGDDDPFIASNEDEGMDLDQPKVQKTKPKTNKEKGAKARKSVEAVRATEAFKRKADVHTSPKKQ
jgi:hypothetical protein